MNGNIHGSFYHDKEFWWYRTIGWLANSIHHHLSLYILPHPTEILVKPDMTDCPLQFVCAQLLIYAKETPYSRWCIVHIQLKAVISEGAYLTQKLAPDHISFKTMLLNLSRRGLTPFSPRVRLKASQDSIPHLSGSRELGSIFFWLCRKSWLNLDCK